MAILAANFVQKSKRPLGVGAYEILGTFTGPTSYTAGGEPLTNAVLAAKFGIKAIEQLDFDNAVDVTNSKALKLAFDGVKTATTQGKIRAFADGGAAANGSVEIAGAVDLHTFAVPFRAVGC
jgi:hypothetical protein